MSCTNKSISVLLLCFLSSAPIEAKAGQINEITVRLAATTQECRLSTQVSIEPSRVYLKPGDAIRITSAFEQLEFPLVTWEQRFQWETKRKDGKDTVTEDHRKNVTQTIKVRVGEQLTLAAELPNGTKNQIPAESELKIVTLQPGDLIISYALGETGPPTIQKPVSSAVAMGAPCAISSAGSLRVGTIKVEVIRR